MTGCEVCSDISIYQHAQKENVFLKIAVSNVVNMLPIKPTPHCYPDANLLCML